MFSLDVVTVADLKTCAANNDCSGVMILATLDACPCDAPELCQVDRYSLKTYFCTSDHRISTFIHVSEFLNLIILA